MKKIGIYVHIPFCMKKCFYCDFVSYCNKENLVDEYIECLKKEIESKKNKSKFGIDTIYIGGGTPSFINENHIKDIIYILKESFDIDKETEITIEVNPGTVNENKLEIYKEVGINRLSMGLQSTNNELLKMLGRIHTYEQFLESYNMSIKKRTIGQLLDNMLNYKLSNIISANYKDKYYNTLSSSEKKQIISRLIEYKVRINGTNTFKEAQVTAGGVSLEEININTMESLKQKNFYIIGELLDVDGKCGGYNLGFAWISGILAGISSSGGEND